MVVTCAHLLVAIQCRLVDVELDIGMKFDATVWRSPTVHGSRLWTTRVRTGGASSARREARGIGEACEARGAGEGGSVLSVERTLATEHFTISFLASPTRGPMSFLM